MEEKELLELIENVMNDRKRANDVVQLLSFMDNPDEDVVRIVIDGLCQFFTKTLVDEGNTKGKEISEETRLFMGWTNDRYSEFQCKLAEFLSNSSPEIQQLGFLSLISMIEKEFLCLGLPHARSIPKGSLKTLITGLICSEQVTSLSAEIREALRLNDLRHFILKFILKATEECLERNPKHKVIPNILFVLENISKACTAENISSDSSGLLLCEGNLKDVFPSLNHEYETSEIHTPTKALDAKESKKLFSAAWVGFLSSNLDERTIKVILCLMEKHIIPHFSSPCILADFLTSCFSKGGGVALLSLHGLFVLMTEHNLDYPKFYDKLYSIVHPRIFDAKYQSRFFYLLDIFLSSTHLSAYLVAAFAKRLSRLLLVAPSYAQPLIVNFILTLIERHPTIRELINRPKSQQKKEALLKGDPYIASQEDPALCKALESSLWELTTVSHHYLPSVSQCVRELNGPKHDIRDLLDETYFDMFDSMVGKEYKEAPMNYVKPKGLFRGFEDIAAGLWHV